MPETEQSPTAPPGCAPTNGSAFSLTQCGGAKGWRYRLIHWLCERWGYFPIPWDAPEAACYEASTAYLSDEPWSDRKVSRALAHAEIGNCLMAWRAGVDRPNDPSSATAATKRPD